MAQLMPLPLTVSCFSKIQIGFTFLVLAYPGPGSPGKGPLNGCVCVFVCILTVALFGLSYFVWYDCKRYRPDCNCIVAFSHSLQLYICYSAV